MRISEIIFFLSNLSGLKTVSATNQNEVRFHGPGALQDSVREEPALASGSSHPGFPGVRNFAQDCHQETEPCQISLLNPLLLLSSDRKVVVFKDLVMAEMLVYKRYQPFQPCLVRAPRFVKYVPLLLFYVPKLSWQSCFRPELCSNKLSKASELSSNELIFFSTCIEITISSLRQSLGLTLTHFSLVLSL